MDALDVQDIPDGENLTFGEKLLMYLRPFELGPRQIASDCFWTLDFGGLHTCFEEC